VEGTADDPVMPCTFCVGKERGKSFFRALWSIRAVVVMVMTVQTELFCRQLLDKCVVR